MTRIVPAHSGPLSEAARSLFQEYAASLDFDLCFQNFNQELAEWPGEYSPPKGRLFVALIGGKAIGSVGLREFHSGVCEMKRLYVQPLYRGRKIGRQLAEVVIKAACNQKYTHMRLDTLKRMTRANQLYRKLGFRSIPAYRDNPITDANYLELDLGAYPK